MFGLGLQSARGGTYRGGGGDHSVCRHFSVQCNVVRAGDFFGD